MRARRWVFRALLGSIAISALMGIWAILGGDFDDLAMKVLGTSLAISGASVLGLAALSAWHMAGARLVSRGGVASSIAALVLFVPGIWIEVDADEYWQLCASFALLAVGASHGALLAHTRLAPRFAWARLAAGAVAGLLACLLLALLWEVGEGDGLEQAIAVASILVCASTLAVIVFHFMSRVEAGERGGAEVCFCPRCGKRMWQPAGVVRCTHCDGRFRVEVLTSSDIPTAIARGE